MSRLPPSSPSSPSLSRRAPMPHLAFAPPRKLPKPGSLEGRVVVLDIAFAATVGGGGVSFETVTRPFIEQLGDRLAAWVDHHDHDRQVDFADDSRFVLCTKAEHGGCPEMITPEMVERTGPIDTILAHMDLDGLYAAAKWILGGREPYPGADDDARCIDTRIGVPGPVATRIDHALRARFRDHALKCSIIAYLVEGLNKGVHDTAIREACAEFQERHSGTMALGRRYRSHGRVAYVDARGHTQPYDKTDLLLAGQERAEVSVVHDSGMLTIAAPFDSGWDFVALFDLKGGMPTRVTVPEARLDEVLATLNQTSDRNGADDAAASAEPITTTANDDNQ